MSLTYKERLNRSMARPGKGQGVPRHRGSARRTMDLALSMTMRKESWTERSEDYASGRGSARSPRGGAGPQWESKRSGQIQARLLEGVAALFAGLDEECHDGKEAC